MACLLILFATYYQYQNESIDYNIFRLNRKESQLRKQINYLVEKNNLLNKKYDLWDNYNDEFNAVIKIHNVNYSVFDINVFSVACLIQKLLPFFNIDSHVVNISSIGGVIGSSKFPGLAAYSASKGALNILTEVLAEEYKESGPKFNSLSLGSVNTPMLKKAFPGYEAQVNPNEMASYIYNFANNGSKLFNGKVIPVSSSTP